MKIVHVSRPQSQIVTRNLNMTPVKRPRKAPVVDEAFMKAPIDLRKLDINKLPQSPDIEDDSALSIPLTTIVGKRSQSSTASDHREIDDLKVLLQSIEREKRLEKSQKREFHLSDHLCPPRMERFCPEQAYAEQTIHKVMRDRDIEKNTKREVSRPFPFELFNSAIGKIDIDVEKKKQQKSKPTFAETETREIRDFFEQ